MPRDGLFVLKRLLQREFRDRDQFKDDGFTVIPVDIRSSACVMPDGHELPNESNMRPVGLLEQVQVLTGVSMFSYRLVAGDKSHIAALSFAGVIKDTLMPVIFVSVGVARGASK
jgi:hypothetical protein